MKTVDNICEVAVQIKHGDSVVQTWDIRKFEEKLNHMKDIYDQWITTENPVKEFLCNNKILMLSFFLLLKLRRKILNTRMYFLRNNQKV